MVLRSSDFALLKKYVYIDLGILHDREDSKCLLTE